MSETNASRRRFLTFGAAAIGAISAPSILVPKAASASPMLPRPRPEQRIKFHNLHTGEKLDVLYWQNGRYDPSALKEINWILRDWRTNDVKQIDQSLIDLLSSLQAKLETTKPVGIISGYRCPATNAMLAGRSSGVASKSYHLKGMAIDIRVDGRSIETIRDAALNLKRGGVGYYPSSQFVHVDVGPVRKW